MIRPHSYVDVLINQGLADIFGLKSRISAWREIFELVQPSVIIADHAPTVLLTRKLYKNVLSIAAGDGFAVPPIQRPFPPFSEKCPYPTEVLISRETTLLSSVLNPVLQDLSGTPMENCQELFSTDTQWLFGLPELDHYQCQRSQPYLGASPSMGGAPAFWPTGSGPRVFLYTKNHPAVPHLLKLLKKLGWPTLIYAPEWSPELQQAAKAPNLHMSADPLDLEDVGRNCDFAINNGGLNGVIELLFQGIPQLLLPLHIEQTMFTRTASATGAVRALPFGPSATDTMLQALHAAADPSGSLKTSAGLFAEYYHSNPGIVQVDDLLAQLEAMDQAATSAQDD
jgi:hypothetical protein